MRAITVAKAGGPEVLVLTDQPDPRPGPGEVLIRTHAAGVNYMDTYQRTGLYPVSYPFTPGGEASGIVEAVGDGVTSVNTTMSKPSAQ